MADSGRLVPRRLTEPVTRAFAELSAKVDAIQSGMTKLQEDVEGIKAAVRFVADDEANNRLRLYALRESESYELAFSERKPLVSFIIPTYRNFEGLRDVSLPSVLAQSHSELDVIVIGDGAPPETEEVVKAANDKRVRYINRTYRGPYPEDASSRWRVIANSAHNEAVAVAQGRWIAQVSDDDAVRPDHVARLLDAARHYRLEHCYGKQLVHFEEGEDLELGEFPPREAQWGMQAAIYHAGLSFLGLESIDAVYEEPSDWSFCRRMLAIGVRTGMIDEVVCDKFETRRRSATEWLAGQVPAAE